MNIHAQVKSPEDFEVTITMTMKVSELRQVRAQNAENEKASHYPLSQFTHQLIEVCGQVDRVYRPDLVDVKPCPKCGEEIDLAKIKTRQIEPE
jgi:hypothetical protein